QNLGRISILPFPGKEDADATQRVQEERCRLHFSGELQRAAKVLAGLVGSTERRRREPEPAERGGHPPAMIRPLEALEAGERVLHRLLVVTEAVRAHARAAQRVAGATLIA